MVYSDGNINSFSSINKGLIDSSNILELFEELNSELSKNNLMLDIALYRGSVMTLLTDTRPAIRCIDYIFSLESVYLLDTIKDTIAFKYNISNNWIYNEIKEPIEELIKEDLLPLVSYSNLLINAIEDEQLLAMKILASRSEPSKDFIDSFILCKGMNIKTREQLMSIIRKYVPERLLSQRQQMFIKCLGEDLGYEW